MAIILLILLGILLLLLLLLFTLFRVNKVELHFKNETSIFNSVEYQNEIISTSGILDYSTIFSVKKSSVVNNIEKEYPYIKVINIETVFPNSIIIHCAQREEAYYVQVGNNLYYLVDEEFKVLGLSSSYDENSKKAVLLFGIEIDNKTAKIGEVLEFSNSYIARELINSFAYNNKNITDFIYMFKSVEYEISTTRYYYTNQYEIALVLTTYDNFKIKLELARCNLIEKVGIMIGLIPKSYKHYNTSTLIIELNPENVMDYKIVYKANME